MKQAITRDKILAGRKAVDVYRQAHNELHSRPGYIPDEQTPLLNKLLSALKEQGFVSLKEFFEANQSLLSIEVPKIYLRQGKCNNCGVCCEGCPQYLSGICAIYATRPQWCKDFPTVWDFIRGLPKECSYQFVRTGYQGDIWR